ncbi:N-acetylmuramoyl-L-alanine amidase [Solibacillus isronensis]|uniref:N-acetylmuramoyl-L-alanine amidase n=1 Tax=Solibacillus isronensis TaxID=412383 RepID=UPI0009A8C794|nr:N-acetylmuramoyl-L-alanine amidase [Solibacillus isronensis]
MLTISAGHYGKGTGASGYMNEGEETVSLVQELGKKLQQKGVKVKVIIDNQSKSQQQNLTYLVKQHNATQRELDVSIHFNSASAQQKEGIGTEVLYVNPTMAAFAQKMSTAIANAGKFKNRGAKQRTNLAFLNGTTKKAILIEVCFVNSEQDVKLYRANKDQIIEAIAETLKSYFPNIKAPTPTQAPTPAQPIKPTPPAPAPDPQTITSKALQQKVEAIFNDKEAVREQLKQGVQIGAFQPIWLENFDLGKLTLYDYIALTTLQYQKNNSNM